MCALWIGAQYNQVIVFACSVHARNMFMCKCVNTLGWSKVLWFRVIQFKLGVFIADNGIAQTKYFSTIKSILEIKNWLRRNDLDCIFG